MIERRDIVEVPFNLPQGIRVHPAIVLSTNEAIQQEGGFIALMMTTDETDDEFSFELTNNMLTKKLSTQYCQARLHLISYFHEDEAIANSHHNNKIKEQYFKGLIEEVNQRTFGLQIP